MNTKNFPVEFVFILLSYSNIPGASHVLGLLNKFYPDNPIVIENNNPGIFFEEAISLTSIRNPLIIVNNKKNLGFAAGCNDGARKAVKKINPSYLIFLNDDTDFDTDWIKPCLYEMKKRKWVATVPVLRKPTGEIENVGYFVLTYGKIQLVKNLQNNKPVDGLTGAALIFQTDIFQKLNGFDERFFAYLEDVDLFLRAKKTGYKFGPTKEATVFHIGQGTWSGMKSKKAYLDFRNWILLIAKHWSAEEIVRFFPQILIERMRNLWGIVKSFFN